MSYKIPCGEILGHGNYCEHGHLCESCSEIARLTKHLTDARDCATWLSIVLKNTPRANMLGAYKRWPWLMGEEYGAD